MRLSSFIFATGLLSACAALGAITYPGHADTADRLVVYGRVIDHPGGEVELVTRGANEWSFTVSSTFAPDVVTTALMTNRVDDHIDISRVASTANSAVYGFDIQQRRCIEEVSLSVSGARAEGWRVIATNTEPATVTLSSASYEVIEQFASSVSGTTNTIAQTYDTGSVWQSIHDEMSARLDGASPVSGELALFSTYYPTINTSTIVEGDLVRNTNSWLSSVDLTAISPWNTQEKNKRRGIAISPLHVLFATHYPVAAGQTIYFVTADNTLIERTITALAAVAGSDDITIGLLDSDLPATISPMATLPSNWATYWPSGIVDLPVVVLDQLGQAKICGGTYHGIRGQGFTTTIFGAMGLNSGWFGYHFPALVAAPDYLDWQGAGSDGDSGNPMFVIVNGRPVLLCALWFSTGGPDTAFHTTLIEAAMEALSPGGYQLTHPDLSGFNAY